MLDKGRSKLLLAAGGVALASWCMGSIANGTEQYQDPFVLRSTTFQDGGLVPMRMAFTKGPNNPDCFGQNISPQLSWTGMRPGVKSFAITMFEMEDPPHTDLVVYGIPANVSSFAEGELSKPSDKFVGGKNFRGLATWRGMCPPPMRGRTRRRSTITSSSSEAPIWTRRNCRPD